jgi:transposase
MNVLMSYIHGKCSASREDIEKALEGTMEQEDRDLIQMMMKEVKNIETSIEDLERKIEISLQPYQAQVELLQTIPGVKSLAAASLIAELGVDMNQFQSAAHLSAWAGLCPGNNQSAGKIKSSRIRKGNRHLKVTMTQVAWAISRTKHTYLGSKYRALVPRKSKKRAIIAIGRKTLVVCYHMLKDNKPFHELGESFLNNLEPDRKAKYHEKRLEELGYHVVLSKKID